MNFAALLALLLGLAFVAMGITGSYASVWQYVTGSPFPISPSVPPTQGGGPSQNASKVKPSLSMAVGASQHGQG